MITPPEHRNYSINLLSKPVRTVKQELNLADKYDIYLNVAHIHIRGMFIPIECNISSLGSEDDNNNDVPLMAEMIKSVPDDIFEITGINYNATRRIIISSLCPGKETFSKSDFNILFDGFDRLTKILLRDAFSNIDSDLTNDSIWKFAEHVNNANKYFRELIPEWHKIFFPNENKNNFNLRL